MVIVYCDVCKKEVMDARKEVNYNVILDKDLCLPCKEKLEGTVKKQITTRPKYFFKDYYKILSDNLQRMCK